MIAVFNTSYIKPVAHSILSLLKKSRHNYQQVTCFWTLTRYSTHGLICCLPRLAVQCRLLELPSFMAGCFLMTIQIQFAGHATMIWVGSKSVYHVLAGVLFIGELQSSGRCANCLMTSQLPNDITLLYCDMLFVICHYLSVLTTRLMLANM